jgi:CubicO group peptidase (beta-lactamase class C family)
VARRTAADRAEMVRRLNDDLGEMRLEGVRLLGEGRAELGIRGGGSLSATITMEIDPAPPHHITGLSIEVGDGEAPAPAERPAIRADQSPDELAAALDRFIAPRIAQDSFAGVVVVARDGEPRYARAFGVANRGTGAETTLTTRHNVASIGKIFTKTAIAQLLAGKKLALTSTIGELLPDYPNAEARAATVEQLVTHRAGIADFFGPGFEAVAPTLRRNADYYRYVAAKPLTHAPGSKRAYCNGCYVVLGAIVEKLSGQRYEDYIAAHVFTPAGMKGAAFLASDHLPADAAIGYTRHAASVTLTDNRAMHGIAGSGAGGCYATAADLIAFDGALRTNRLTDAAMTAWVLESAVADGRNRGPLGVAGGAPGTNAILESDGTWTVAVVANLDPPAAGGLGTAILEPLSGRQRGPRIERR